MLASAVAPILRGFDRWQPAVADIETPIPRLGDTIALVVAGFAAVARVLAGCVAGFALQTPGKLL